jgi:hypothetical protein
MCRHRQCKPRNGQKQDCPRGPQDDRRLILRERRRQQAVMGGASDSGVFCRQGVDAARAIMSSRSSGTAPMSPLNVKMPLRVAIGRRWRCVLASQTPQIPSIKFCRPPLKSPKKSPLDSRTFPRFSPDLLEMLATSVADVAPRTNPEYAAGSCTHRLAPAAVLRWLNETQALERSWNTAPIRECALPVQSCRGD